MFPYIYMVLTRTVDLGLMTSLQGANLIAYRLVRLSASVRQVSLVHHISLLGTWQ